MVVLKRDRERDGCICVLLLLGKEKKNYFFYYYYYKKKKIHLTSIIYISFPPTIISFNRGWSLVVFEFLPKGG
jgi:hypothetical protein